MRIDNMMRRIFGSPDLERWFDEAKQDGNPLLTEWFAVHVADERTGGAFGSFQARKALVGKYSWAVPCRAALDAIAKLSPLVEVGAGTGYWTWLLRKLRADVLAFDQHPPTVNAKKNNWHPETEQFVSVQPGGPEVVSDYPDRTLFLCWPPYADPFAVNCLRRYRGNRFAFVGENDGGCTGCEEFWSMIRTDWDAETEIDLPQWLGIHDYLTVFHKRGT